MVVRGRGRGKKAVPGEVASESRAARSGKSKSTSRLPLTVEQELFAYREMLLIRRFEERTAQLYGMGLIGGFCHLYIGQEAVVVGMQMAAREGDQIITSYRDHGHMLACGMDPGRIMAELTGRRDGYSKGKGGSMHMFSVGKGFYGGHGIVAAQVPLGTGLAFANHYRGDGRVCLTYFGEGAANQGQMHESLNMASLWKLPVVYIIENNRYAMGTEVSRGTSRADSLSERGTIYGIPGRKVDGMDVGAVKVAGDEALAYCRAGNGPIILEMATYRYRGHSMSDPAKYRTKEEVRNVQDTRDPITSLRRILVESGRVDEERLRIIEKEVHRIVLDSAEFAKTSPEPSDSELWTDVWC